MQIHRIAAHAHHAPTRTRNQDGRFRKKRSDTHLGTLEAKYGEISDRRADCHLGPIREATGMSLHQLLHHPEITHKPGLDGRVRNQDGRIHGKRGDTFLATIEQTYGPLTCLPGTTPLFVLRMVAGDHSLTWILNHPASVQTNCPN